MSRYGAGLLTYMYAPHSSENGRLGKVHGMHAFAKLRIEMR